MNMSRFAGALLFGILFVTCARTEGGRPAS